MFTQRRLGNLSVFREKFAAGVANNSEIISAQDSLARANDNQIGALYRYNQSRANLAHATGQMEQLYAKCGWRYSKRTR